MQLATSQRPLHPPPVPPRPSRQVVAEALKKSPRPPCPTRQAPPPPNKKPWRFDEQRENAPTAGGASGRTLVYESVSSKEETVKDEDKDRVVPTAVAGDKLKGDSSYRREQYQQKSDTVTNDAAVRQQKHVDGDRSNGCSGTEFAGKKSSEAKESSELSVDCTSRVSEKGNSKTRVSFETDMQRSEMPIASGEKRHDDESKRKEKADKKYNSGGDRNGYRLASIAATILAENDNAGGEESGEYERRISATISSDDDGATVVIIDETEQKSVTFGEEGDNNIHHQDWLEAGIRYSSTQITLSGDEPCDRVNGFTHLEDDGAEFGDLDFSSILERIAMSSLQGLPPLPRSLSGFNLNSGRGDAGEPPPPPTRSSSKSQRSAKTPTSSTQSASRPSPPARQLTTLDTQLAILRREMFGLRQLDLSLLSQLWSLNESIQEFRQLLQEQEDRAPSPSPSSDEGDDTSYGAHPPPPPRRPAQSTHHHRPPRPPRPLKPPPSDESPSSEEYGAV